MAAVAQAETLAAVKLSMRITVDAYDSDIADLIDACLADLEICCGKAQDETDKLTLYAVKVFCQAHFGNPPNYDKLANAYDAIKGTLMTSTGYTEWGGDANATG